MVWRLAGREPGSYELRLIDDYGFATTKSLVVSDRVVRRSPIKVSSSDWLGQIAYPAETPVPKDGPIEKIELAYPEADVNLLGWKTHWLIAFVLLTIVFAFALRGPLRRHLLGPLHGHGRRFPSPFGVHYPIVRSTLLGKEYPMPSSTLTSKGQITIPKEVRDTLDIRAGDRVAFILRSDGVVELRPETVDLRTLYGALKRSGKRVSIEQMNRDIAESVVESQSSRRR